MRMPRSGILHVRKDACLSCVAVHIFLHYTLPRIGCVKALDRRPPINSNINPLLVFLFVETNKFHSATPIPTILLLILIILAQHTSPSMFSLLNVLFLAHFSLALQPHPRTLPTVLQIRQSCSNQGEATCENSCMPLNAVCCDDGSSTFCPFGNNCISGGCCPVGETCSGGGGTITYNNPEPTTTVNINTPGSVTAETPTTGDNLEPSATTAAYTQTDTPHTSLTISATPTTSADPAYCSSLNEVVCHDYCIPSDGICCSDNNWCFSNEYCVANGPGGCCISGEICVLKNGTTILPSSGATESTVLIKSTGTSETPNTNGATPFSPTLNTMVVAIGVLVAGYLKVWE